MLCLLLSRSVNRSGGIDSFLGKDHFHTIGNFKSNGAFLLIDVLYYAVNTSDGHYILTDGEGIAKLLNFFLLLFCGRIMKKYTMAKSTTIMIIIDMPPPCWPWAACKKRVFI